MNLQKLGSDALAIIRANIKLFLLNVISFWRINYHPLIRFKSHINITVDTNSRISIGNGTLIAANSSLSATDGGQLTLGNMIGINRNSMIICHNCISIGDNTIMGPNVCIYDHDHLFTSKRGVIRNDYKTSAVHIGKNCWIGAGTTILRGSIINDNCIIGAGCVIKGTYPSGSIIIQKRNEIIYNRL